MPQEKVVRLKIQLKLKDVSDRVPLVLEGSLNNKMISLTTWEEILIHLEKMIIQKIKKVLIIRMKQLTLMS